MISKNSSTKRTISREYMQAYYELLQPKKSHHRTKHLADEINSQNNYPEEYTPTKRLLRLEEVMIVTGLKKSVIYEFMKDGRFPKTISLGRHFVAWDEGEIHEWIDGLLAARGSL